MSTLAAVMPVFNQGRFVTEAIESIINQVQMLVVVNDGSTDDSRERIAAARNKWKFWYVEHGQNEGAAAAINTGIRVIRELERDTSRSPLDWLTWVSSDNVHYPDWAEGLIAEAASDIGVVYSGYDAFPDGPKMPKAHYVYKAYDPPWLGQSEACYIGPSFIVRADVWQEHRGQYAHDYDNWCRVEEACWAKNLRIVSINRPLCRYRMHPGQATHNRGAGKHDARHWLQECKARRAAAGIMPPCPA